MTDRIRVVLVDDHDLVREGLRSLLGRFEGIEVVGEAGDVDAAVTEVLRVSPDLVLLDLRLGAGSGIEVATRLREAGSTARILVLSVHDSSRNLRESLAAGADGYLLKSTSGTALADGIRKCVAGETVIGEEFVPKLLDDAVRGVPPGAAEITAREQQVLELVSEGLGNRELAGALNVSVRTAQKHVENLFKKFGVHDRTELISQAFRRGVLE